MVERRGCSHEARRDFHATQLSWEWQSDSQEMKSSQSRAFLIGISRLAGEELLSNRIYTLLQAGYEMEDWAFSSADWTGPNAPAVCNRRCGCGTIPLRSHACDNCSVIFSRMPGLRESEADLIWAKWVTGTLKSADPRLKQRRRQQKLTTGKRLLSGEPAAGSNYKRGGIVEC